MLWKRDICHCSAGNRPLCLGIETSHCSVGKRSLCLGTETSHYSVGKKSLCFGIGTCHCSTGKRPLCLGKETSHCSVGKKSQCLGIETSHCSVGKRTLCLAEHQGGAVICLQQCSEHGLCLRNGLWGQTHVSNGLRQRGFKSRAKWTVQDRKDWCVCRGSEPTYCMTLCTWLDTSAIKSWLQSSVYAPMKILKYL